MTAASRSTPQKRDAAPNRSAFQIECVYLSCFDSECGFLGSVLHHRGIRLHRADTLESADFLMTVTDATVIISDTVFLDGGWQDAAAMIGSAHPQAAFLVAADAADRSFVSEAPDHGALAIIWKPLALFELGRWIERAHEAAIERRRCLREEPWW